MNTAARVFLVIFILLPILGLVERFGVPTFVPSFSFPEFSFIGFMSVLNLVGLFWIVKRQQTIHNRVCNNQQKLLDYMQSMKNSTDKQLHEITHIISDK